MGLKAKCIDNIEEDYSQARRAPDGGIIDGIKYIEIEELKIGKFYKVSRVDMGQSHTNIELAEYPNMYFNSVLFDFYLDGRKHDIYNDPDYNPYL